RVRVGGPARMRDYDDPVVPIAISWTTPHRVRDYDDAVVVTAISGGAGPASSRFLQCDPLLRRRSPTPASPQTPRQRRHQTQRAAGRPTPFPRARRPARARRAGATRARAT